MARFTLDQADNYGGNGGAGFFSLKNDKDVARVRFMYNSAADIRGDAVHQVEIDGKKRYVTCLREYNQPIDVCPFCRERMEQSAKLFIPLYDIDEDKVKVWERGRKFFAKISSVASRYPDLVKHVFEIERNGKAGSTQTTYEIYEVDRDDTIMEDLPEAPKIIGGLVLDKTADDMEYFLECGSFPPEDGDEEELPRRRRDDSSSGDRGRAPAAPTRRTPSNRGRGDRF